MTALPKDTMTSSIPIEDHLLVIADFVGKLQARTSYGGVMQYDRAAMREKEKARAFADVLDRQ